MDQELREKLDRIERRQRGVTIAAFAAVNAALIMPLRQELAVLNVVPPRFTYFILAAASMGLGAFVASIYLKNTAGSN